MMKMIIEITETTIRESPDGTVFIFGDNLEKIGNGGQASVARKFVKDGKAFGIPTKRRPSSDEDAFFSDRDDEKIAVKKAFERIREMKRAGKSIVFFPKIGEGLADLPKNSPEIYGMIRGFIESISMSFSDWYNKPSTKTMQEI